MLTINFSNRSRPRTHLFSAILHQYDANAQRQYMERPPPGRSSSEPRAPLPCPSVSGAFASRPQNCELGSKIRSICYPGCYPKPIPTAQGPSLFRLSPCFSWSERPDSNRRPPHPQCDNALFSPLCLLSLESEILLFYHGVIHCPHERDCATLRLDLLPSATYLLPSEDFSSIG